MDATGATVSLAQQNAALDRDFVLSIACDGLDTPQACIELGPEYPAVPHPERVSEWEHYAAVARADMQRRGISPPAGERMAREQPDLHFLYRAIASAGANFDREALRKRINAMRTKPAHILRAFRMPTLFITGAEDTTFPPFIADALARLMPNATVEQVRDAGHSVYFERAEVFNGLLSRFFTGISEVND